MKLAAWLLIFALVLPLCAGEKAPADPDVLKLENFKIHGRAQSNFAISIQVFVNKEKKKTKIFITEVAPGTDASRLGLHEGDEIVKVNGLPVADLDPRIDKESPLGKLLLNREPGDPLDLEIISRQPRPVTLHALKGVSLP